MADGARQDDLSDLVGRLRKGDTQAFEQIIEQTQRRLLRHCFMLCGDQAKAEELAQDVCLKMYHNIKDLKNPAGLISWMFTIARRSFIDQTRSVEFKVERLTKHDEDNETSLLSFLPSENSGQTLEDSLLIRETLAQMRPESRVLLLIVYQEGYSGEEASQVLGIESGALRTRLHRAKLEFIRLFKESQEKESQEAQVKR